MKQFVKEFFPKGHLPLWKEVRVGKDCNQCCRARLEKLQKDYPSNDTYKISFEDQQKKLHTYTDHNKQEQKPSYHPVPDGYALCGHKFSTFYKIDWDRMEKEMHNTIVIGFRLLFQKRNTKYVKGSCIVNMEDATKESEKEFRDDQLLSWMNYNEPLADVINRFVDENIVYDKVIHSDVEPNIISQVKIVKMEYTAAGWTSSETNNDSSALVLFEVGRFQ